MQNHRALLKAVTLRSLMLSAVFAIIFLILFRSGAPPYLLGLVFGSFLGILNFRQLGATIEKAVAMPPAKAQSYVTVHYFIRFSLVAVAILVSILSEQIQVLGTVAGLLTVKLVIYMTQLLSASSKSMNISKRKEE
ncbi:ATP synthase subunit I [Acidaminobacter sp.]|uniref:ATP synthase subunit I n=1 Tax=Acidaminobacter sp. TaxID=1872102 RepID=UPI001384D3BA|nr:ATP synthase subunit I [Acidaminobacter sp.]MDK9712282.1 ATP synthase subunit I [Acidaminobacter sp.]MZQ96452.1 ATP synthase subunit I [Acidaminobacter sp.]